MTTLEIVGIVLAIIPVSAILYALMTFLGTLIPVNWGFRNDQNGVKVFISSNGVHTDFLVPAINGVFDWSKIVNSEDYARPLTTDSYVGLGWGDRGFYLEIPTWADLTPKIAMRAVLIPSRTVMHVTVHTVIPPEDAKFFKELYLSEQQYLRLCAYISKYFKVVDGKVELIPAVGYTPNDNFYEAVGSYHAFNTCNFWVNKGLMKIGVRTALWSPFDRGIFYQLKRIN